jgi:cell division protein FtsL
VICDSRMPAIAESICSKLRQSHKADEFFYPDISMDIEISGGLEGEVAENIRILEQNGFEATATNVLGIMESKRQLLAHYRSTKKGKKALEEYRQLLVKKVKPVGTTMPTDLMFVTIIVSLLAYMVARFTGSFADEAGKILARKLLEKEKKLSREHNLTINEYRFLKNQAVALVENGTVINTFSKQLKRKRKKKTKANTYSKSVRINK